MPPRRVAETAVRADDHATHRVPDDERIAEVERGDDGVHVTGHGDRVVGRTSLRLAVPADVDAHDPPPFEQRADDGVPGAARLGDPVHEHQGGSGPRSSYAMAVPSDAVDRSHRRGSVGRAAPSCLPVPFAPARADRYRARRILGGTDFDANDVSAVRNGAVTTVNLLTSGACDGFLAP